MTRDEASSAGPQGSLRKFPLPGTSASVVAVPAPGGGPGYWAGASSAALDEDGTFVAGYRVRNGHEGTDETVIARSDDGERFTTVATLEESAFGAKGMERPSLSEREGIVTGDRRRMITTRYTHQQLASMVGSNREAVTRAFGRLRKGGAVEIRDRYIYVTDADALERFA